MQLTIEPKGPKGRSFTAELLACAQADSLWTGGQNSNDMIRPVWMVLAGSELELRAFMANMMTGKVATVTGNHRSSTKYELMRSAGYAHHTVKIGGGAVTTVYLPNLFCLDPGMVDPEEVNFVVIPAKAWVDAQSFDLGAARTMIESLAGATWTASDAEAHTILAEGVLFLSYLDRRCRYPIPFAPAFGAWLLMVCKSHGLVSRPTDYYRADFKNEGAERVQALPGFACSVSHETLGQVLSEEVRRWFPTVKQTDREQLEQWLNSLDEHNNGA